MTFRPSSFFFSLYLEYGDPITGIWRSVPKPSDPMTEELNLVHDLAVILIAAGVFTLLSKALKQPPVLGYIIAGFLVGPHVEFFPGITSTEAVSQWSEIGIIFLLFGVGLEFSFKRLLKVGSSAVSMSATQFLGMMASGILLGQAIGLSTLESLFLGCMLSVSSTAIVVKAYDDMGLKNEPQTPAIFGALVVQDLISIVMLVLLPTVAISHGFSGGAAIMGVVRLAFFLVLWFLVGIYLIPSLLQWARSYLNDEILLVISIGLCFAMVALATAVGFSSALGAFVMGSILSETVENERIMQLVSGLKTLFGAIFFVSVGMMLDPGVIAEHWGMVLAITLAVLTGTSFFAASGALLAGNGIERSVICGFSVAQVGEFAFILATLGMSLGVLRDFIYPVIIAVSVITVFATPYMIKAAPDFARWLRTVLPEKVIDRLDTRADSSRRSEGERKDWLDYIKAQLLRVLLYGVLVAAVFIGSARFLPGLLGTIFPSMSAGLLPYVKAGVTIALMCPFLVIMVSENSALNSKARRLLHKNHSNVWLLLGVSLVKLGIAVVGIFTVLASNFNMTPLTSLLVMISCIALFFIFIRFSYHYFIRLEKRFLSNYTQKEDLQRQKTPVTMSLQEKMSAYDVKLAVAEVSPDYPLIGKTLAQQPFRELTGVNIVKITRGERDIFIPSGDEAVYPYDLLVAVGTSSQTEAFSRYMEEHSEAPTGARSYFVLENVMLDGDSPMTGRSLRDLDLRSSRCMVISIVTEDGVVTNPSADFVFRSGDLVWIGGDAGGVRKICGKA